MMNVALYTNQPVLLAAFRSILASQENLVLSLSCARLEPFIQRIQTESHDVLLIEVTPETTVESLSRLKRAAARAAMVLWTDTISTEFTAMVIGLGVRGILRKSLSIELHLKCLRKVAEGELWLEKTLSDRLLACKPVVLTPTDRQLLGLLGPGSKEQGDCLRSGDYRGQHPGLPLTTDSKLDTQDRLELAVFAVKNFAPTLADDAASAAPDREGAPRGLRPALWIHSAVTTEGLWA
jgi:DNA-binding NarL/FixJ family response regulator